MDEFLINDLSSFIMTNDVEKPDYLVFNDWIKGTNYHPKTLKEVDLLLDIIDGLSRIKKHPQLLT